MGGTEYVAFVVLALFVAAVVLGRRSEGEAELRRWTDATGISLSDDRRAVVRRFLSWSRRGRRIGALLGFASPWIASGIAGGEIDEGSWSVALMLVGYLIGALVAEVVVHRQRSSGSEALLRARRLGDYLPTQIVTLQRALGVVALALVVPYAVLLPRASVDLPSVPAIVPFALGAAAIAASVELIERRIVARRQSLSDVDDAEMDDALRSTSIHIVAGAGLALLVQFAGPLLALSFAAGVPGEAGGIAAAVVIVASFALSLVCWMRVAHPARYGTRVAAELGSRA